MENKGESLHIRGLRMDVSGLSEMDEAVWSHVRRSIVELVERGEAMEAALKLLNDLVPLTADSSGPRGRRPALRGPWTKGPEGGTSPLIGTRRNKGMFLFE